MKFSECVEIVGSKPSRYQGIKQYVSTGSLDSDHIDENSIEEYAYDDRPSRADLVAEAGNVLFAKMAETKKTLVINNQNEKYLFSTGFFAVKPKKNVLTTECLYYLLNSNTFLSQKDKYSSGATQKAISNASLEKIIVNIPCFSKQEDIVKQLDKLSNIIKKTRKQLLNFDLLIKSRFIEMFGDEPVENRKWKVEKLGTVCSKITDGTHKTPSYQHQGITFISAKNIIDGKIDLSDVKHITKDEYAVIQKRCNLEKGDVLLTKSGSLGSTAIFNLDIPVGLFESLAILKYDKNLINGVFLKETLQCDSCKRQFANAEKGIAIKHLHLNVISNTRIPVPPIELQQQFAAFVQQIDKSKFEIWRYLKFSDIMNKIGFILYD